MPKLKLLWPPPFHEPPSERSCVEDQPQNVATFGAAAAGAPLPPTQPRSVCQSVHGPNACEKHREEAPHEQRLGEQDIHVWAAKLDQSPERISAFKETLAPDELDRAARFHFERDRNRFIAGRGILRRILSSYLEIRPSQLDFQYSPRGKPALKATSARPPLHFNLGHSKDLILIAVTKPCPVGIDAEWVRPIPELENIARQYLSTGEAADMMALPKGKQLRAFYQLWTRKEAGLKASGEGLTASTAGNKTTAPLTLVELAPASNFVGAVAAPVAGLTVSCWQWPF